MKIEWKILKLKNVTFVNNIPKAISSVSCDLAFQAFLAFYAVSIASYTHCVLCDMFMNLNLLYIVMLMHTKGFKRTQDKCIHLIYHPFSCFQINQFKRDDQYNR